MLVTGIAVGFGGVALLTWSEGFSGEGASPWAIVALLIACLSWSIGSLRSRSTDQGNNMFTASAMQMIAGGAAMLLLASLAGEWSRIDLAAVSLKSVLAYAYLVVFGSLVAFSAYVWLLSVVSPAAVSTYAYVNPIVAVLLGWWLANERLSPLTLVAGALIVSAVVLMTLRRAANQAPATDSKEQAATEPHREPPVTVALPPSAAIRK
jgi:drug/metabolite transporter (DMT)-like permease